MVKKKDIADTRHGADANIPKEAFRYANAIVENNLMTAINVDTNISESVKKRESAKEDANYKENPDVDYTDLEHFIDCCRRKKDKESFNTAIKVLETIKKQVLG